MYNVFYHLYPYFILLVDSGSLNPYNAPIMTEITFAFSAYITTGMAFIVGMMAMVMCGCFQQAAAIVERHQK
jgi:uncharacterized membrane protein YdcZ (DUF606 family)